MAAEFDPRKHKVYAVDWTVIGTAYIAAESKGQARSALRDALEESPVDLAEEAEVEDVRELDRPAEDALLAGASEWRGRTLAVGSAMRLIRNPNAVVGPVDALEPWADLDWLKLAASLGGHQALESVCVRDGHSTATDGIRLHLVEREVREPGLWDGLSDEAREGKFPNTAPIFGDRRPNYRLVDLPAAWPALQGNISVGGAIVNSSFLRDALVGAVATDGSLSEVLLGVDAPGALVLIFMPGTVRIAAVMPLRPGSAEADVNLDPFIESVAEATS